MKKKGIWRGSRRGGGATAACAACAAWPAVAGGGLRRRRGGTEVAVSVVGKRERADTGRCGVVL